MLDLTKGSKLTLSYSVRILAPSPLILVPTCFQGCMDWNYNGPVVLRDHSGGLYHPVSVSASIQPSFPSFSMYHSHKSLLQQRSVDSVLHLGVTWTVPPHFWHRGFCYSYFLVPKTNRGWRSTLDFRRLSIFICHIKFLIVTLASIIPSQNPMD